MIRSYSSSTHIAADAFVDLQTHTQFSDGEWTPETLISHFVHENFAAAAITDHDRVDTTEQLQRIAREHDFPLLIATEMTTRWQNSVVDILCFGFGDNLTPLEVLCDTIHQAQTNISRQVYENLVRSGYISNHNEAELNLVINATTSRQPHLLFDLFEKHNPNFADGFGIMKKAGYKLCANPTTMVVEAVHRSGGVAVIAHPGRTDGFATFDTNLLDTFRQEIPIDGIEVYYPRHTPEQIGLYREYAHKQNWLISAGSDSHTSHKPPIKYRADQCAALLERLDFKIT